MQLRNLHLEKFLTHNALTLDLSVAPVHLIAGRNGSGKSSIANAIEFLMTGRARGVKLKKDAQERLGLDGQRFKITLTTDAQEFTRGPGASALSFPWSDDLLGVVTSPMRLVTMAQADRQTLFREVMGGSQVQLGSIIFDDLGLKPSVPKELASEVALVLTMSSSAIDQAEKHAVDGRRVAKRALQEVEAADTTAAVQFIGYEGEADPIDVSEADPVKVREHLAELEGEHRKLLKVATEYTPERVDMEIAESRKEVDGLKSDFDKLGGLLNGAKERARAAEEDAAAVGPLHFAQSRATNLRQSLSRLSAVDGRCIASTEDHEIACPHDADIVKRICADLGEQLKAEETQAKALADQAERGKAAKTAAQMEANSYVQDRNSNHQKRLGIQASIERLLKDRQEAADWQKLKPQADTLEARIAKGRAVLAGATAYQAAVAAVAGLADRKAAIAREIEAWDSLAGLLGKDGPVRPKLAEAMTNTTVDKTLQEAWGCEVVATPDGGITYNGRPIEFASYSEQWRGSMLVADMLAQVAGTGFIVLDQVDSLDEATRLPVSRWAAKHAENGYETILILLAESKPPDAGSPAWTAKWWIDGDGATRVDVQKGAEAA